MTNPSIRVRFARELFVAIFFVGFFAAGVSHVLAQNQRALGLDISAWQGNISQTTWNNFHNVENRQFIILRSSRGGTTGYYDQNDSSNSKGLNTLSQRYDDPYFIQNINRVVTAGMFAGTYHFSRPDIIETTLNSGGIANTGTDEADHFIQMAGPWMRPGYLPPMHDLEAGSGIRTADEMAQFCIDFSDRIYEKMGIRPSIYVNGNYAGSILGGASASLRHLIARPPPNLPTNASPSVVSPCYPYLVSARWPNQTNPDAIDVQNGDPKDSYSAIYGPWDDYGVTHPWKFWQYASTLKLQSFNNGGSSLDADVAHGGIEFIKDNLIPAVWMNDSSGNWGTLTNWNSGQTPVQPVPGPGQVAPVATSPLPTPRLPGVAGTNTTTGLNDTVILERPNADITVTLSSGSYNIRKLYMRETLNITSGSLTINYVPSWDSTTNGAQFSGPVSLSGGASLSLHTLQVDATNTFTIGNGTLTFNTINLMPHGTTPAQIVLNGDVNFNALSNATATIANGVASGNSGAIGLSGGTRGINVGSGSDITVAVPIQNGGLTKNGSGTLRLTTSSTYAGGTTVSAGRLLVSATTGSATGGGSVTVNGGTLGGTGTIDGTVTVNSGGKLAPGQDVSLGTLTLNSAPVLNGTSVFRVDRNGGITSSDKIVCSGALTYGGTLMISNIGAALVSGDTFTLFSASSYSGSFSATNLPALGSGLFWNLRDLTNNGTIRVDDQIPTPPSIVSGPDSVNVIVGQNAAFAVATTGTLPLAYQWSFNGTAISGATLSSYTRTNVQISHAGSYTVVVTNALGSATSAVATLTVIVPPAITTQPQGQVVAQGGGATFAVAASGTVPFSFQWRFNGANVPGATLSSYTRTNIQATDAGSYSVVVTNVGGTAVSSDAVLVVQAPPAITTQPQDQMAVLTQTASFSVLAAGTAPLSYQWRQNGTNIVGATSSNYTRTQVQAADGGSYSVLITNAYGSILSSNAILVVDTNITAPAITSQPQSQTIIAGQNVTFAVSATSKVPISYQWHFNGAPIAGATSSAYTRSNGQTNDAGTYSVVLTNIAGATTSTDAMLAVNFSLAAAAAVGGTVSKSPDQASYAPNTVVTLTATPYTNYLFTGWSGDVTSTANPLSVTMNGNKSITADFIPIVTEIVIDNTDPGWTNSSASGSWTAAANASVPKIGTNYLYSSGTGGSPAIRSCRWVPNVTIAGFYDVFVYYQIGANRTAGATYKVFHKGGSVSSLQNQYSTLPNQGGWFQVGTNLPFVTGRGGYVELGNDSIDTGLVSADAAKFVLAAPFTLSITAQPQDQTVALGAPAAFNVTATGTAPLTYQWRLNGTNLAGATASSYTRTNAQFADAGTYSVVVSNIAGTAVSANALLSVLQQPPGHFENVVRLPDGRLHLQWLGDSHFTYTLQVSSNLLNWDDLSIVGTSNTLFEYIDDSVTNHGTRYYRTKN